MIIVSQDGEKIINFNNITQVYITFDEDDYSFWVRIETVDSVYEDLGNYKTAERAKELLEEIARCYRLFKAYEFSNDIARNALMKEMEKVSNCAMFAYYMPKG